MGHPLEQEIHFLIGLLRKTDDPKDQDQLKNLIDLLEGMYVLEDAD